MRYRAPRSAMDASTTATARDLVPTKVAAVLWDKLMKYKASLHNFPQSETCDLLIVDRSIDPVSVSFMNRRRLDYLLWFRFPRTVGFFSFSSPFSLVGQFLAI